MANKLICIVGMCGAGKSQVSEFMREEHDFGFVRFGQIVLDKITEMGKGPSEALEREVRESIRKEHGMAAMAIANLPKIDALLEAGDVLADGLYSWEEYLVLQERYGDNMTVIAVYAPPIVRYARLEHRSEQHKDDTSKNYRDFTQKEASSRDRAEIENLHKAGPIAMADYTIINTGSIESVYEQTRNILNEIVK